MASLSLVRTPADPAAMLHEAVERLEAQGDADGAVALCRSLLAQDRRDLRPRIVLAVALLAKGELHAALAAAEAALALERAIVPLLFVQGTALHLLGHSADGAVALSQAVARDPQNADAWLNLGIALTTLDRLTEAEAAIHHALALAPHSAPAWASLGTLMIQQARPQEAMAACANAVQLRPDFAPFRFDEGLARLLAGDFAGGWEGLRWRKPEEDAALAACGVTGAEWDTLEVAGRTLLLCATQGLGDAIQFARYIPLLAARGARLIVRCQRSLHRLLAGLAGVASTIAPGDTLPPHDGWMSLGSLPRLFATTDRTVPFATGYLTADQERAKAWRQKFGRDHSVGLVWAGNASHANDARRSLPPSALEPLLRTPGRRFVSLQVGRDPKAFGTDGVVDLAPYLTDLAETAAVLTALDLIVTVDTAVAHLAGALGRPVWIALPYAPDWRWQLGRSDSPWYASARLFRQPRPGDWASVVGDIAAELPRFHPGSV